MTDSPVAAANTLTKAGSTSPGRVRPLVTIAVPAYNRPALLAEALASIEAQTVRRSLEVIVCDDGRLEANRQVVARFPPERFRYIANERTLGAVANWNRCLERAEGEWVMILHEDDCLYPWYLETVWPLLVSDAVAVAMKVVQGGAPPEVPRPRGRPKVRWYRPPFFLKSSMTPFPGVLIRRDAARQLGGFDGKWGPVADFDFWYRLSCLGRIEDIRAVGAFYRISPGQWTDDAWARMLNLAHLLRLRIAQEQFPNHPVFGHWLARFFTRSNARAYDRRFGRGPAVLRRCLDFKRCMMASLPTGWVWQALKIATALSGRHSPQYDHEGGRDPQIQPAGGEPGRLAQAHSFR